MHTSTTHISSRWRLLALVSAVVLVAAACTADWDAAPWNVEAPSADRISELRAAEDCDSLVAAARPVLTRTVESMWGAGDDGPFGGTGVTEDDSAEAFSGPATTVQPVAPSPAARADSSAGDALALESGAAGSGGAIVGTNNQEVGVDEVDLVKTDGRRIVSIVDGTLRVVDLDGSPAIDGALDLSSQQATSLFLRGDTALVLGTTYGDIGRPVPMMGGDVMTGVTERQVTESDPSGPGEVGTTTTSPPVLLPEPTTTTTTATTSTVPTTTSPEPTTTTTSAAPTTVPLPPAPFAVATTLTLVSIADPARPTVLATAAVEGSMVSARELDGLARVVVQSTPGGVDEIAMATSRAGADALVADLAPESLLPRVQVDGRTRMLGDCQDVMVSAPTSATDTTSGDLRAVDSVMAPQQLSTVTVLTVGDDLAELQPVSVQGAAETVYASTDALYVAAGSWDESGSRTDIHRFGLGGDGPATYTGSGRAPGRLLNQFSLSDREGALRVVTTLDAPVRQLPVEPAEIEPFPADDVPPTTLAMSGAAPQTSARLTILDTEATLDEIGHIDGLGLGEEVQSVRFLEDLGYVVTFRQIDPLYALDLSDPRNPTVLGELKIPGFSEYLHPIGDGLLVGVGRDVDPSSGTDRGLKVSLFDVSDPAAMVEVDQILVAGAWSPISDDHKAFTWDPERRRAIVPVDRGCVGDATSFDEQVPDGATAFRAECFPSGAALVIGVDDDRLGQVAEVGHAGPGPGTVAPIRSMIVGSDLWTLSQIGIGRSDVAAPSGVDLLGF